MEKQTTPPSWIRRVAVLGAGVMGAQIAAHLVNCKVPVVLFDLCAKEGPRNGIALRAIEGLKKLKPAPLALPGLADAIEAANYDDHLEQLAHCDLVIEAIAERLDWKQSLYQRIAPHLAPHAVLASNTSGLSMASLAQGLPAALAPRFVGVHFFNPPRYMHLVELIATEQTDPAVVDRLETFLTTTLGKGIVRAQDTPNFIANRVGVFGMLSTMIEVERFGLTPDVVDDLTGAKMGRAKSGTFRTADVVGLDTLNHVIKTMQDRLSLDGQGLAHDSFAASYATPPVLAALLARGALGQKSKAGFYRKDGKVVQRFDLASDSYVASGAKADETVARILKKAPAERLKLLRESSNPQAQFCWAILRNVFHYAAVHLASIADTARDLDWALRWGFGWQQGPFELWQQAGWAQVAQWVQQDINEGKALSTQALPAWVSAGPVADAGGVHTADGSWSAAQQRFVGVRSLPVYARQIFRAGVVNDGRAAATQAGVSVFEDDAIRLWSLPTSADASANAAPVLIASLKSKMHAIGPGVLQGLRRAVAEAEAGYAGLVIWSPDEPFSVGADLQSMLPAYMSGGSKAVAEAVAQFQQTMLALRYAQVPCVAAVQGMALGGGCELLLHCAHRVAALESYIGLVEVGVGLLPAGGGLKEAALRASNAAKAAGSNDILAFLKQSFEAAAMAKVATSALEAQAMGYLTSADTIVAHNQELLHVAISQARALSERGYRPPLPAKDIVVAGRSGISTIGAQLINLRDGGFISAHDYRIGMKIAEVVCGGDVEAGSVVDEAWILAAERRAFAELVDHPKTQERIMGLLQTGKPVRN